MSVYWGYRCQDCNQETDHWFNHGEEQLSEYFAAYQLIKEYQFRWFDINLLGGSGFYDEMQEFLDNHLRHNIVLCNEYGDTAQLLQVPKRKITSVNDNNLIERWRSILRDAINAINAGDTERFDLLARLLAETDEAKQLLRSMGYGCTGQGILSTVKESVGIYEQ